MLWDCETGCIRESRWRRGGEGRPSEDTSEKRPLQGEQHSCGEEERCPWHTLSLTLKTEDHPTWRQTRYHQICSFYWRCHCWEVAVSIGHMTAKEQPCMAHTVRCLIVYTFSVNFHHCLQTNMSASRTNVISGLLTQGHSLASLHGQWIISLSQDAGIWVPRPSQWLACLVLTNNADQWTNY